MNNTNNNKILLIVGAIVVVLIFWMLLGSRGGYGGMMFGGNNSNYNQGIISMNQIDRHFIEQMIPHHDGAIAMAELALEKSKKPEIRTLAQTIITAQKAEINDMTLWYKNWFGKNVPKVSGSMNEGMMGGNGMHMGVTEDVKTLENAVDFDRAFVEQMIPHHQLAIMMAQMMESGTERPEMQELAKNIIKSQSEEIKLMQGWYK
ncbi:MAG: DUF305 domain-containing protein [Candidatus Zambryskibacteria bacterium]|nr:DUF305 domain-containing protein [Candidatus Zambryskibacteria bacterium]